MPETEPLALTLPIRRLVEFLLRSGSIDSRFTGFDRANEGARLHRKLQRAAAELLEQACALMAQAKSCHDELETYYRTAVDFAQVDAAAAQCMELFGVG